MPSVAGGQARGAALVGLQALWPWGPLGGSFVELHCLGSGIQFELLGSGFFRIALNGNAH